MPITTDLPWNELAIYAVGAALILVILFKIPYVGRVLRALFSFALLAFGIFLVLQQAPFDPNLSRITANLGLDTQEVVGNEVILSGTVRSWAEREEAERVAWSAPGVTKVTNLITVSP